MRLLIVEDEKQIANSLKRGFEQERFAVDVAYDGEEGFDLAASEPYDIIVLDLMLPYMDGVEITKKLRRKKISTPIIMLTARDQTEDKIAGLNSGADDYLAKPFSFDELLARVRALLRRPKHSTANALSAGKLRLDPSKFNVTFSGKSIKLSKKEFSLLEYMLRNKDKTLTKDQIIEKVWDFDADILPNTVEVYVGYLRNKIDKRFGVELIKTVRGFGYKLVG